MYDEKLCIYYEDEEKCKLEDEKEEYQSCCTCHDKCILKEGQEITITTVKTLKRKNGKIIELL